MFWLSETWFTSFGELIRSGALSEEHQHKPHHTGGSREYTELVAVLLEESREADAEQLFDGTVDQIRYAYRQYNQCQRHFNVLHDSHSPNSFQTCLWVLIVLEDWLSWDCLIVFCKGLNGSLLSSFPLYMHYYNSRLLWFRDNNSWVACSFLFTLWMSCSG